ncbi:hypothetical protein HDU96_007521 [Phlyctochytrium bullatum]|nr:hypothetical protein HDU96_007521 [Phlyctochytrium bullatum]
MLAARAAASQPGSMTDAPASDANPVPTHISTTMDTSSTGALAAPPVTSAPELRPPILPQLLVNDGSIISSTGILSSADPSSLRLTDSVSFSSASPPLINNGMSSSMLMMESIDEAQPITTASSSSTSTSDIGAGADADTDPDSNPSRHQTLLAPSRGQTPSDGSNHPPLRTRPVPAPSAAATLVNPPAANTRPTFLLGNRNAAPSSSSGGPTMLLAPYRQITDKTVVMSPTAEEDLSDDDFGMDMSSGAEAEAAAAAAASRSSVTRAGPAGPSADTRRSLQVPVPAPQTRKTNDPQQLSTHASRALEKAPNIRKVHSEMPPAAAASAVGEDGKALADTDGTGKNAAAPVAGADAKDGNAAGKDADKKAAGEQLPGKIKRSALKPETIEQLSNLAANVTLRLVGTRWRLVMQQQHLLHQHSQQHMPLHPFQQIPNHPSLGFGPSSVRAASSSSAASLSPSTLTPGSPISPYMLSPMHGFNHHPHHPHAAATLGVGSHHGMFLTIPQAQHLHPLTPPQSPFKHLPGAPGSVLAGAPGVAVVNPAMLGSGVGGAGAAGTGTSPGGGAAAGQQPLLPPGAVGSVASLTSQTSPNSAMAPPQPPGVVIPANPMARLPSTTSVSPVDSMRSNSTLTNPGQGQAGAVAAAAGTATTGPVPPSVSPSAAPAPGMPPPQPQPQPQKPQPPTNSHGSSPLPATYLFHYAHRLRAMVTHTLSRTRAPAQIVPYALLIVHRLVSLRTLPEPLATPTRLLLASLMLADVMLRDSTTPVAAWCAIGRAVGAGVDERKAVASLKIVAVEALNWKVVIPPAEFEAWLERLKGWVAGAAAFNATNASSAASSVAGSTMSAAAFAGLPPPVPSPSGVSLASSFSSATSPSAIGVAASPHHPHSNHLLAPPAPQVGVVRSASPSPYVVGSSPSPGLFGAQQQQMLTIQAVAAAAAARGLSSGGGAGGLVVAAGVVPSSGGGGTSSASGSVAPPATAGASSNTLFVPPQPIRSTSSPYALPSHMLFQLQQQHQHQQLDPTHTHHLHHQPAPQSQHHHHHHHPHGAVQLRHHSANFALAPTTQQQQPQQGHVQQAAYGMTQMQVQQVAMLRAAQQQQALQAIYAYNQHQMQQQAQAQQLQQQQMVVAPCEKGGASEVASRMEGVEVGLAHEGVVDAMKE